MIDAGVARSASTRAAPCSGTASKADRSAMPRLQLHHRAASLWSYEEGLLVVHEASMGQRRAGSPRCRMPFPVVAAGHVPGISSCAQCAGYRFAIARLKLLHLGL